MKITGLNILRFLYRSNIWISANLCCLGIFVALLIKGTFEWMAILSLFVLSWQVYVADRFLIHPEDTQQTELELDNVRFVRRHRKVFGICLILSLLVQAYFVWLRPYYFLALITNYTLSLLYIVKVPLINRRAKTIPYIKSLYVSTTYIVTMMCYAFVIPLTLNQWGLLALLLVLCAGNIAIFDIKDRDNDRRANIKTLATLMTPTQLTSLQIIVAAAIGITLFLYSDNIFSRSISLSFIVYAILLVRFLFSFSIDYLFICIDAVFFLPLLFYIFLSLTDLA